MRSHISERDEQDTTMTSATASVLDDLFLDDEQQLQHERGDRPEDARPQENKRLQQEDSQVTEAATQFSSQSCTASTATVNSPARITSENVTSDATAGSASKQSQISSSSMSSEGRSAVEECDGVEPPSLAEQVQRDALVTPPSEMTAIAANIPLPPSPIKAASTLTPPGKASPNKSHLINTVTRLAASIPLPASPAGSTSAAQQLQSRASPRPVAGSVHGTPLIDRTMQAALIALPQSVTRPSALSPSYPDSVRTHNGSQNAASAVQMMPFAAEAMVDSPVKMPSSLLHQLPFSRTNAIPSPLTHQPRANKQPSNAKLEAEGILPYAEADSVDSPVKHATVPNHKSTLRLMPFVNEEHIPSPTKKLAIAAELPPSNTEEGLGPDFGLEESRGSIGDSYPGDTDVIMDASLTAGATDEADALTSGFTSEAAEGHAQQSCDLNKAEESRNTVSDADSPLHANEAEPEMLVDPKASHAEIPGDYDVDNLDVKEAIQESSEPFSATPARPVMSITGQATPSAYASPSGTMGSTIHAPATKKRTLSRKPNDALRQDLSISSNSSLSETSAISSGEAGTEYESEERIMMLHQPHDTAPPAVQPSRGLKRKASASSVISVTQSSADQSVQESTRRITRQRSLTALKDDTRSEEKEEPSTTLPLVDSDASPASVPPKRKARDIKEDEQEARPKTGKTTSKLPAARTRRQSTRLASTSGLPQPTSRIGRKVATAKTSSTKPSVTRLVEGERAMKNQKNREEQDPLTSDEEEEHMPTVASRATLSTSENSQALTVDAPTPVPSVVRRPQRSARPARHTAIDAKPLPSPRRAVSPVKKPLRAARAINGATSSTDHDAKGKKATNNDRPNEIPSARVALRSPGRVLLSPAKTNVQPLRSPGRAFSSHAPRSPLQNGSATFDWSSVPPQGQVARLPQTLSPERYRTVCAAFILLHQTILTTKVVVVDRVQDLWISERVLRRGIISLFRASFLSSFSKRVDRAKFTFQRPSATTYNYWLSKLAWLICCTGITRLGSTQP